MDHQNNSEPKGSAPADSFDYSKLAEFCKAPVPPKIVGVFLLAVSGLVLFTGITAFPIFGRHGDVNRELIIGENEVQIAKKRIKSF